MKTDLITVILDTNLFVAAYWARSNASARLIKACIEGRIQAQYSKEVKHEVMKVLRQIKAPESYLQSLEPFWKKATKVHEVSVDSVRVEDPDDQKFIEAAIGGETDYLITNDDHLLKIGYIGRTEILRPGSAARVLGV